MPWCSRAHPFCHLGQKALAEPAKPNPIPVSSTQHVADSTNRPSSQPLPPTSLLGRLMEIESRLLPCGLHVVGRPPTAIEAIATLVNIAEVDRPSNKPPIVGLPGIMARSIGRSIEQLYLSSNKARPLSKV